MYNYIYQQLESFIDKDYFVELAENYSRLINCVDETYWMVGRFQVNRDFQYNPLFWQGNFFEPVINKLAIKALAKKKKKISHLWPQGRKFAVCLSHDVDFLGTNFFIGNIRRLQTKWPMFSIMPRTGQALIESILIQLQNHLSPSEVDLLSPWLAVEEQYGYRSTFFFFPDRPRRYHNRDGRIYRHRDRVRFLGSVITVAELMQELHKRGYEIGLHGTYNSYDDAEELKRQKEQIERSLGQEIYSVRQHHLHFNVTKTPLAQSQAGFKYDSTMGSNRLIGFPYGIAWPFFMYDLESDNPLPIIQIPLHIQDGALLRADNLALSPPIALQRARELIDKVEKVNGLITLLWHPVDIRHPDFYQWLQVYEGLLEYISKREAWVAPVNTIGAWWRERVQKLRKS